MPEITINADPTADIADSYGHKPDDYFAGERADMLALLGADFSGDILEVGCGRGATGRLALKLGKTKRFVGIELMPEAAQTARQYLSQVEVGNAETMDLDKLNGPFSAILCSEVLEHLHDPWAMVRRLIPHLKSGGVIIASSPNIASKGVIMGLLRGNFDYTEFGIMDRTHLRWFTPASYRQMFEEAGLVIESVSGVRRETWKGRLINALTFGRFKHLFWPQTMIVARKK
jgi:2-polyprenyl-3-methyl-5-hydroxy-6-metoxy-1,4-benzoquinol methylase